MREQRKGRGAMKSYWTIRTVTGYYVSKSRRSAEWPDAETFGKKAEALNAASGIDDALQIESSAGEVVGLRK